MKTTRITFLASVCALMGLAGCKSKSGVFIESGAEPLAISPMGGYPNHQAAVNSTSGAFRRSVPAPTVFTYHRSDVRKFGLVALEIHNRELPHEGYHVFEHKILTTSITEQQFQIPTKETKSFVFCALDADRGKQDCWGPVEVTAL